LNTQQLLAQTVLERKMVVIISDYHHSSSASLDALMENAPSQLPIATQSTEKV